MRQHAEELAPELRASRRTNLLLTASIEADGLTMQVRVRNVSETGALIEGPQVPKNGARIWLKRADLKITGTVVWASRGKAGLKFNQLLGVAVWGGDRSKPAQPAPQGNRQQVDALQQAIRDGCSTASFDPAPAA